MLGVGGATSPPVPDTHRQIKGKPDESAEQHIQKKVTSHKVRDLLSLQATPGYVVIEG
jgi:hypothetical protein